MDLKYVSGGEFQKYHMTKVAEAKHSTCFDLASSVFSVSVKESVSNHELYHSMFGVPSRNLFSVGQLQYVHISNSRLPM